MKKRIVWAAVGIVLFVFTAAGWSFHFSQGAHPMGTETFNQGDLIRFRVVANSDSDDDQRIKLEVRDKLLAYLSSELERAASSTEAKEIIFQHRSGIIAIAEQVLEKNGVSYHAVLKTGTHDFPLRVYGSVVIPAGQYEAVQIKLGEAEGKNWWCVLFPPLCFIDINTAVAAQPVSASAAPEIAQGSTSNIEFRWKAAEWLFGSNK